MTTGRSRPASTPTSPPRVLAGFAGRSSLISIKPHCRAVPTLPSLQPGDQQQLLPGNQAPGYQLRPATEGHGWRKNRRTMARGHLILAGASFVWVEEELGRENSRLSLSGDMSDILGPYSMALQNIAEIKHAKFADTRLPACAPGELNRGLAPVVKTSGSAANRNSMNHELTSVHLRQATSNVVTAEQLRRRTSVTEGHRRLTTRLMRR